MSPDELQDFRAQRLEDLLAKKFGNQKVALGRALGHKSGAFIRQLIDRERPISEKTVLAIEALPGCSGWFDAERAPGSGSDDDQQSWSAPDVAHALAVLRNLLVPLTGEASSRAGEALRNLAVNPDSPRAFTGVLELFMALPDDELTPPVATAEPHSNTAAAWRMQAMRLAEAHPDVKSRALLTDFLGKLDTLMREHAPKTEKQEKARHRA